MKILVLGGDKRYIYLMNNLNINTTCIGFDKKDLKEDISVKKLDDINTYDYDIIILPILGINEDLKIKTLKGNITFDPSILTHCKSNTVFYTGVINDKMKELFKGKKLISFLHDKEVNKANDVLTLEGVIDHVKDKDINNVTILGFGNLGSKMAVLFSKYNIKIGTDDKTLANVFNDKFFLTTNKEEMLSSFKNSDLIINTVPKNIIEEECLKNTKGYVLDIASYPYGIDKNISKNYDCYFQYASIPSKYAPDKAGMILSKKIKRDLRGKL